MFKQKLAPSLLSADFTKLRDEIASVEMGGADLLHIDVMDGHFVPNLTIGPFIVAAIRQCTSLPLDVHLMIENPKNYIEPFARAGASMISFHIEVSSNPLPIIQEIQKRKLKAGLALNPETSLEKVKDYLDNVDYVLIMTVHPGFGGQAFMGASLPRIKMVHQWREIRKLSFEIEVDGGIKVDNIQSVAQAGADIFVAGSSIFKSSDYKKTMSQMKEKIRV